MRIDRLEARMIQATLRMNAGDDHTIAKALLLLYMVEMLLVVNFRRPIPRLIMGVTLAFIACRAFLGLSA